MTNPLPVSKLAADGFRYIQVFINVSMVLAVLFFFVQFVLTVRRDVKDRMQEVSIGQSPDILPDYGGLTG